MLDLADARLPPVEDRVIVPLPKGGGRIQDVRLRGRITFPAGAALPTAPVIVTTWGAMGSPGSGYSYSATAPGFSFDSPATDGAMVDIDAMPPPPWLPKVRSVGPLLADSYHEVLLERGVVVRGRLLFAPGRAAPTTAVSGYYADSQTSRPFTAQPPQFEYAVAVRPGSDVSITLQPPAPFLRQRVELANVAADITRDITLQVGVELSGRMRFPAGSAAPADSIGMLVTGFLGMADQGQYVYAMPPDFNYRVLAPPGSSLIATIFPPAPYLTERQSLGLVQADAIRDITLRRGAVLSGRAIFPPGTPPPTGSISMALWDYDNSGEGSGLTIGLSPPDFSYAMAVEPGASPRLQLSPPVPFVETSLQLGPVLADTVQDLRIGRGVLVRGRVTGASDYLVNVADRATGASRLQVFPGTANFEVAAPVNTGVVEVFRDGAFASRAYRTGVNGDAEVDFRVEPRPGVYNVFVNVRGPSGEGLDAAAVEFWRDGRYYASGNTGQQGRIGIELPDGEYELRIWPDSEQGGESDWERTLLFAAPAMTASMTVSGATERSFQLGASDWADMRVLLPTEATWPGCPFYRDGRFELLSNGKVVARSRAGGRFPGADNLHRVITGPGRYVLRYRMPGEVSYSSAPFNAASGMTIGLVRDGAEPQRRWTGTLRSHDGVPVPNRMIGVSDEMGIRATPGCPVSSDAQGRFQLPLCEGCVYEFRARSDSPSQRRIVSIDRPVTASLEQDLRLDPPLALQPLAATGTGRIMGEGTEPFRLVFLAEGYAAERETYTDVNGNGLWDGVQFVDVNGNGLWEADEPVATYGNARYPTEGQDPRVNNEPFQDLNGDGVLSLDDRALFERNVRDYLRGLFSSEQFSSYRLAYQASAVLAYSPQVGMDHGDFWKRSTLFGAQYEPNRGLINIDYGTAVEVAAQASPGYTAVVVMINQPVPYGRVNAFILASGGMLSADVNDNVAAHEFGHNPGGLADEYFEFLAHYQGGDFNSPNSTRFVDSEVVAWGHRMDPAQDGRPSRPWMAVDGVYEGSSYYLRGAFRPSPASMMRFMDSLKFNGASEDQLRRVHARALRGRSGLLSLDGTGRCADYTARWDVTARGVTAVELRLGRHDGPLLGTGGAVGSQRLKRQRGDIYLVAASTRTVLDIETEPMLRCSPTRMTPAAPAAPATPAAHATPARSAGGGKQGSAGQ
ncbi:MAG: M64 family metallopeptidase [Arenimonas sp.]|uniref:M64 family metallopeptidase n=1 Tax=Arenimonas sp. TaxID=1872635 RepID=UPI0025B811C9|nr:M64 family metallopeptidase [Arenimonas sp.]MBW8366274.1 M64 family metallopeptidase [Arenimonas sp.]